MHEFSELIHEVFRAIIQDIIEVYTYKNYIKEEIKIKENNDIIRTKEYKIKKIDRSGLRLVTNELMKEISKEENVENVNEFSLLSAEFIKVILKEKKLDLKEFEKLKVKILEMYEDELRDVINNRLEALKLYYTGKIESCIKKLKNILKKNKNKIPEWIMNDIAIDLRNVQNLFGQMNNIIMLNNEGQKYIDSNDEALFYPMIDRLDLDREKELVNKLIGYNLDSPYTRKFENFNYMFEYVSLIFFEALIHGSITHIDLTLNRMSDILLTLGIKYNLHSIYFKTVKILILERKEKEIERFLRTYTDNVDIINQEDINEICRLIENVEIDYFRKISECLLLKYFKYYFSEEKYNEFFEKIYKDILEWICDENRIVNYGKYYCDMLKANTNRADNEKICDIVIKFLDSKLIRYYDNVFQILKNMELSKLNKKTQEKIKKYLIDIINDDGLNKNFVELQNVVIHFRLTSTIISKEELDETIKKKMTKDFIDVYMAEISRDCIKEQKKYIKKSVEAIHKQNEKQGKDGVYHGFYYNEYISIRNIIKFNNINLETKEINEIMKVLMETLLSTTQTVSAKNNAILLIIFLKQRFNEKKIWKKYKKMIVENNERIVTGKEKILFEEQSILLIKFNLKLLYSIFDIQGESEDIELLIIAMQLKEYEKIRSLEYVNYFLEEVKYNKVNKKIIKAILEYACIMCKEKEIDMRYYATKCLILLTESPYEQFAIGQLINIIDSGTSELKIIILSKLKEISKNNNNKTIDYIIKKSKVDNNYLVRKIASNFEKGE